MKPPAFAYAAPTTVDEALELLGAPTARACSRAGRASCR